MLELTSGRLVAFSTHHVALVPREHRDFGRRDGKPYALGTSANMLFVIGRSTGEWVDLYRGASGDGQTGLPQGPACIRL